MPWKIVDRMTGEEVSVRLDPEDLEHGLYEHFRFLGYSPEGASQQARIHARAFIPVYQPELTIDPMEV